MEKKAHLLRVGKDSAGSHKVHESKFLSSHFQIFSGGGPPDPIRPSNISLLLVGFHLAGPPP